MPVGCLSMKFPAGLGLFVSSDTWLVAMIAEDMKRARTAVVKCKQNDMHRNKDPFGALTVCVIMHDVVSHHIPVSPFS